MRTPVRCKANVLHGVERVRVLVLIRKRLANPGARLRVTIASCQTPNDGGAALLVEQDSTGAVVLTKQPPLYCTQTVIKVIRGCWYRLKAHPLEDVERRLFIDSRLGGAGRIADYNHWEPY